MIINGTHDTFTSGYSPAASDYAHDLPNLADYAKKGILPAVPKALTEALARHAALTDLFLTARADKDGADAKAHNTLADSHAVEIALRTGNDPTAAAANAAVARATARTEAENATAVIQGFRKPLFESAGKVMGLVQEYNQTAQPHLAHRITTEEEAVAAARQALADAETKLRERITLSLWLDNTRQERGALFPPAFGLEH